MKQLKKLMDSFFIKDGEKKIINTKKLAITVFLLCSFFIAIALSCSSKDTNDTSFYNVSSEKIIIIDGLKNDSKTSINVTTGNSVTTTDNQTMVSSGDKVTFFSVEEYEKKRAKKTRKKKKIPLRKIKYRATQVIIRKNDNDSSNSLPRGTNLIGKLLVGIDTREKKQSVKVLLPYGGDHQNGGNIPRNTILFGTTNYKRKGKKVYINFDKAITPTGKEFKINAIALNSKDYSTGPIGVFHSNTGLRVATTLGLTMVGAMAETLTEKQTIGNDGYVITAKSNMKNALYNGLSKVSKMESNRQAQKLNEAPEYVTISVGSPIIISLTKTFKGASF